MYYTIICIRKLCDVLDIEKLYANESQTIYRLSKLFLFVAVVPCVVFGTIVKINRNCGIEIHNNNRWFMVSTQWSVLFVGKTL
jgi:nitrogen fixation/metabolism regulation signal transduction histidine kinase